MQDVYLRIERDLWGRTGGRNSGVGLDTYYLGDNIRLMDESYHVPMLGRHVLRYHKLGLAHCASSPKTLTFNCISLFRTTPSDRAVEIRPSSQFVPRVQVMYPSYYLNAVKRRNDRNGATFERIC